MAESTDYRPRGDRYPVDPLEAHAARIKLERIPPEHDGSAQEPSATSLLRELATETANLVRSELQVFKLEARESARELASDSLKIGIFSGLAVGGLLSLLAFAIVGLGELLAGPTGDITGYWLSALIVGVLLVGLGGGMAAYYVNRMRKTSHLDTTREELERDRSFLQRESQMMREVVRP